MEKNIYQNDWIILIWKSKNNTKNVTVWDQMYSLHFSAGSQPATGMLTRPITESNSVIAYFNKKLITT